MTPLLVSFRHGDRVPLDVTRAGVEGTGTGTGTKQEQA
jgi:hypothetical protein